MVKKTGTKLPHELDADTYGKLLDIAAQADAAEGIRQGCEDAERGRIEPARLSSHSSKVLIEGVEQIDQQRSEMITAGGTHTITAAASFAHVSRNFYILAAVLGLFAILSGAMSLVPSTFQPGLPANGSLWRTVALILLLAGLAAALFGVMSNLFEQVDRRSEETRRAARQKRRGGPGDAKVDPGE